MNNSKMIREFIQEGRQIQSGHMEDDALGPLSLLPGTWTNTKALKGHGWNMIAVPFADGPFKYRLLMNQYNETLKFETVDKGVANRGEPDANAEPNDELDGDQVVAVLGYEQTITQIAAADSPTSGLDGDDKKNLVIHHEPGLWMHIGNHQTDGLDIARLSTIPHGNSVLALGKSSEHHGAPAIPKADGLPIGLNANDSIDSPYLAPYKHFDDFPFQNVFSPSNANALLEEANRDVDIEKVIKLEVDTKIATGGVVNIPFIVKQANATEMTSTFWIQILKEKEANGKPKLRLQYTQTVFLEFFPRKDGKSGRIRWPHISINTLEKISD